MPYRLTRTLLLLATAISLARVRSARSADVVAAPAKAEQGLSLTLEAPGAKPDTRPARLLALSVPDGTPPSPFLPPGKFKATWAGDLNLRLRERMSFAAAGRGRVTVSVKDKVVFRAEGDDLSQASGEVVRLDKGVNPLVVTYESPDKGDAWVRIEWKEQKGLRAEALPPAVFSHDPAANGEAEGRLLREGRQLIADLRCTKCHQAGAGPTGMPELAADAPSLTDVGDRLQIHWLTRWVGDPKSMRADAHMPQVALPPYAAWDVAGYLSSLRSNKYRGIDPKLAPRGGQLFASLNCVGCHTPPDMTKVTANDPRVPLGEVARKFFGHALSDYLLNPQAHYAWNPMPNFKLDPGEADSLAAYLLEKAPVGPFADPPPPNVDRGRELVRSAGCLNCHTIEKEATTLKAPDLAAMPAASWDRGCMAADPAARKAAPNFGLTDAQREALRAFAATDRSSLARDTAAEFSARQVASMRCTACHGRDGRESLVATTFAADDASLMAAYPPPPPAPGAEARGETLSPDQRPPVLTWAGEKLRPEWAAAFIAGKVPYKPRPYLRARMPAWPTRAEGLAKGLAAEHGYAPATPPYPAPDEALAATGQKLIGAAGGFSCVQCHAVGAQPPLAPFEAPALNFANVTDRLREEHYLRWVFNPIKVDPATKMPAFADGEGKSALRDVYDGDAGKQFESIWQFLLRGEGVTPPK